MERDPLLEERLRMVRDQIEARGVRNPRVLQAMMKVPRHLFVPEPYTRAAYQDRPLPIGEGQTISQPYIVAYMTELLDPQPSDSILEIGAGSGYQAALLAELAARVVTIERLPEVAALARKNLSRYGIKNVKVMVADGTMGWLDDAPYDGIIITAAAPEVPPPLLEQLRDGGRFVAPIGGRGMQELVKVVKKGESLEYTYHGGVVFVPLIGRYGWREDF